MERIKLIVAYLIAFGVITSAWWIEYVLPAKETPTIRYFYPTEKEIQELNAGIR